MGRKSQGICFFNTLTRRKEPFKPLQESKVKMYTCGPTVYDVAHIGNFRAFLFEDLLRRWLEYRGFEVTQIMNLTDVDDRTIAGSMKHEMSLNEYTRKYIDAFFEDLQTMGIQKATHYPRATENISEMVALIKRLMEKGYAYKGEDGSIYYQIAKFKHYGKLSKTQIKALKPGARVKADEYPKEEAQDFALWKAWDEEDGEVFWQTEIGKGRPGWHIECSAMSMKYLGETFDIHTGGVDNIFPHHENEIAQSEAATGKKFVNYWLHCEHLLVEGKRMAKRFGNYYTVEDLTKLGHNPKAIRYLLLSTHYRQQMNFTFEALQASKNAIDRLANFMFRLRNANGKGSSDKMKNLANNVQNRFCAAMDDDLNVGSALAILFEFVRQVNNLLDAGLLSREDATSISKLMMGFDTVLGVINEVERREVLPKNAEELIRRREEARGAKDWKTADEIRQELKRMGIIIEDTPQGVSWRIQQQ